jgi:hypothetical protein
MAKLKREQIVAIGVILIVALLGVSAYLMYANNQKGEALEQAVETNAELEAAKAELDKEYNLALEELEAEKGDNEQLNNIIEQQKSELKAQKMKIDRSIRQGKNTSGELAAARKQIQALIAQKDSYLARIYELNADKKLLEENVVSLTSEKTELESTLTEVKETAAKTEEVLTSEKEKLAVEKEKLSSKVARGSVLNTRNIKVVPLKTRRSGKDVDTKFANKTEKLNICFDIDENAITPSGNNKILIRILTPLGETLYMEGQGSGEFANQTASGAATRFTTSKGFSYNNKAVNQCIDWSIQTPLAKGTYTAEVYNKGYKIGSTTFLLK